ncbi:MAG TPA: hypothetical protein VLQ45_31355 [Thermoanaerobaculia bacterium]|nr:hypothetical protein [Thermoanaerobaculia bacterium]
MNHGDIAYISQDRICLSRDLLRPLSVRENSELAGIYTPLSDQEHPDFFLTPISFRAWPYAAAMRIDVRQEPGMLAKVTALLEEEHVNILLAQTSRKGQRAATWNLVLDFEKLHLEEPRARDLIHLSEHDLPKAIKRLENAIYKHEILDLQQSSTNCYRHKALRIWDLHSLASFYRYSQEKKQKSFPAVCITRDTIDISQAGSYDKEWDTLYHELPTLGFASMDTDSFCLRITVLQQSQLRNFRTARIRYIQTRNAGGDLSTRGLIHSIAEQLKGEGEKADWDLWKLYDQTERDDETRELGTVDVVMERVNPGWLPEHEITGDIRARLNASALKNRGIEYKDVSVYPISHRRIFVSIQSETKFKRRRDVLALCRKLAQKIGVHQDNVVTVESYSAGSVTTEVSETIKSCSGMLQFYLGDGSSMDWLNAEFFLATYLGIPCIRFVDPAQEQQLLFQRDRPARHLPDNASDLVYEEIIGEALCELDEKMRERS